MNRKQRRAQGKNGQMPQDDNKIVMQVSTPPTEEIKAKYREAKELYEKDDYLRAAILFSEIMTEQPDHFGAIEWMGICSLRMELYDKAELFFRGLTEHLPLYGKGFRFLGITYFVQEEYRKTVAAFEQAIALGETAFDHLIIARCCGFIGEDAKGQKHAKRAHELDSGDNEDLGRQILYFFVEHFTKIESEDDILFGQLMRYEKRYYPKAAWGFQSYHNGVVAKAYNDMKEYEKSFERHIKAAKIKHDNLDYDHVKFKKQMTDMVEFFTKDYMEMHKGNGIDSEKPVFILGMPRSGTTLLEQVMHAHPEVVGIGEDPYLAQLTQHGLEPPHNGDMAFPWARQPRLKEDQLCRDYRALGQAYLDFLNRKSAANRVVNKAINNFYLTGIIALSMPNAKMIHIERHPLDSCVSTFSKLFVGASQPYSYDLKELGEVYALHKDMMAHWYENCPVEILHVRYEDMVADLETQARRVVKFLNLPWDERCLKFYEAEKTVKTASKQQVFQPIFTSSLNKWKRYEKFLAPLVEGLGPHAPEDCRYILEKYGI